MANRRYLCCTWGEEGAAIMDLTDRNTPTFESTPAYTAADGQVVEYVHSILSLKDCVLTLKI